LTANAKVATVLGSIPAASYTTVESERWQAKQVNKVNEKKIQKNLC
jgi:hypothetical protein